MNVSELSKLDIRHWVHPVSTLREHEKNGPIIWDKADGIYLYDKHGRKVQDAFSGLWCVNAGYGQKHIIDAGKRQLDQLCYATGYFGFSNEQTIILSARLAELAPGNLNRVIFGQGGSDSVDTAIKVVINYYNALGKKNKKHFIALERGYHGCSSTSAGITALKVFHDGFDLPLKHQHHIESHYPYRNDASSDSARIISTATENLTRKVLEIGVDNVAAFICEPIQGSGGVIVPPAGFLKAMESTCKKLGILFIVDEVITGFGRTGKMFACEHENVQPDILILAKGLTSGYAPMGATMITDAIYDVIADNNKNSPFGHGQTYSGHPVSAAIANAAIDMYIGHGLLENGKIVGDYFNNSLNSLLELEHVGEVRGKGMLCSVEIVLDKDTKEKFSPESKVGQKILQYAFDKGLVFRAFSDDILGFAPSLNYTNSDIDRLINILHEAIRYVTAEYSN
ncbi:hypothetical protein VI06_14510 [Aquitalea magnusonii]|nr:hypothetical protein VI06_14510 [Aquitalea magnusonii]